MGDHPLACPWYPEHGVVDRQVPEARDQGRVAWVRPRAPRQQALRRFRFRGHAGAGEGPLVDPRRAARSLLPRGAGDGWAGGTEGAARARRGGPLPAADPVPPRGDPGARVWGPGRRDAPSRHHEEAGVRRGLEPVRLPAPGAQAGDRRDVLGRFGGRSDAHGVAERPACFTCGYREKGRFSPR